MANVPITRFTGRYLFLSNFYPAPILYEGITYASVEHAYQAAKTDDIRWRQRIRGASTPGKAKVLGQQVPWRTGWDDLKIDVMYQLLRLKFHTHWDLANRLCQTGTRALIECNYWGDRFWGVYRGEGANHLGLLLMHVRSELQEHLTGPT